MIGCLQNPQIRTVHFALEHESVTCMGLWEEVQEEKEEKWEENQDSDGNGNICSGSSGSCDNDGHEEGGGGGDDIEGWEAKGKNKIKTT